MPAVHSTPLLYSVQPKSSLHSYFTQIGQETTNISMHTICSIIKKLIMKGQNFDKNNPSIILCNQLLENIFGMKALHISQVQNALAKSLISINKIDIESIIQPTKIEKSNNRYRLSDHLRELFIASGIMNPNKQFFTYQEAANYFSAYIIANKDYILDSRNISVAIIKNDPLAKIFKVKAFHRNQVYLFLKPHLFPCDVQPLKKRMLRI